MGVEKKGVAEGQRKVAPAYVAMGCVGFIASIAVPATAQEAPVRLQGVTVTDSAIEEDYRVERLSSPKQTAPLVDTPRVVNVITQELLADTASFSFEQALRTVPGITLGAGEGGVAAADIPLIRGVDATSDVFVDGARDVGSQSRETFAVERIEVFKGPSSAFGGRGTAAGAINIVSKLAREGTFATATATVGTADLKRITVDANAEVADGVAFRVAGLWHDSEVAGRDAVRDDRWGVSPSVTFGLGSATTGTLSYYHYETDAIPDYGVPLTASGQLPGGIRQPVDVDYDNFYGLVARDFQKTKVDAFSALFRHDFGNGWSLSNTARYARTRMNLIVTNPDDSAGNVRNGLVWRSPKSRNSTNSSLVNNFNISGEFVTGTIGHSLSFGAEYGAADTENVGYVVESGNRLCPPQSVASYNCTSLANPNPHDPWTGTIAANTTPATASVEDFSLYLFDTLTITPRLLLNGGVRWTTFEAKGSGCARGVCFNAKNEADFWSYQGAVIFKPTDATSLYFSYANAKSPPGADAGEGSSGLSATNEFYEPQTTENLEVGAKAELMDGNLLLNAALFQINRGNIIENDPLDGPIAITSKARLRGFEVGASGRAGPVSVAAGYTYLDSELRDGSVNEGKALPNTPKSNLAATVSIEATPRFSFGGGVYHGSERFADAANLLRADGYWRFDAHASFELNDHVGVRVNVQNVADERYVIKLRNPHFAVPAAGRQAMLTLVARY